MKKKEKPVISYDKKQIESFFDSIPALIFIKDREGRFILVNKKIADAHNLSKEELIGANTFDLYPKEHAQKYLEDDLEVIKSGKPKVNIFEPWVTKEGKKWVITKKTPYKDKHGKIIGVTGVSIDVTEEKKLQERIIKQQNIFTKIIVHELKSPLMNIVGLSDLILNETFGKIPQKAKQELKTILSESFKIKERIDKLSFSEHLEEAPDSLNIVRLNTSVYLKKLRKEVHGLLATKSISLRINNKAGNTPFYADPEKLSQVFINLIDNSIKHSKPKTTITISARKSGKYMVFEVRDQGTGIPDEEISSIFKKFTQESSYLQRKQEGLGLGLYICKEIIKHMHGTIKCKSKVGKGTKITFTLPLKKWGGAKGTTMIFTLPLKKNK